MKLSLVLHAHQPPGNYDSVFQRAIDTCYGPVLDLVEERPALRLSLHCSGSLLEWMETHAAERVEQIRRLVAGGQLELVAAGMYEPVLSLLHPRDRAPQIRTHRAYLQRLFGADARGGWLTERVWEPSLAADLVDGGIEHVILDDRHLLSAGLLREQLGEPWITESQGKPLLVAPAAEDLRMTIPWHPVDEVLDLIARKARAGTPLAVYADDIEKFGMWPGTYRDVIRAGWLARFFDGIAALPDVEVVPLGEALAEVPPAGRVYVPDGTYPEMLEWSLPVAGQHALRDVRAALERRRLLERTSPFMRTGQYLQFLAKYPEVNHLHKRMLDVSARVAARSGARPGRAPASWDPRDLPEAQLDLWRAQANCAYWHGLFGGVYLPHIRQRLWHHLLRAERALEELGERRRPLRAFDLDADREDELLLTTERLVVAIEPAEGTIVEVSDRALAVNLGDTLARRLEGYHEAGEGAPYPYDRGRRGWFVDRFLPAGRPPSRGMDVVDVGDFEGRPYAAETHRRGDAIEVTLRREAGAPGGRAEVAKALRIEQGVPAVEARYDIHAVEGVLDARFAVEVNLGVLFAEEQRGMLRAGEREFRLPRGGAVRGVDSAALTMEEPAVALRFEVAPPADLDVRPIETVARSEGGYERSAQQLAVLFSWPLRLDREQAFTPTLRVVIESEEGAR